MADDRPQGADREYRFSAVQIMEPRLREAVARLGLLAPGAALTPAAAATFCGLEDEAEAGALLRVLHARGLLDVAPMRSACGEDLLAYRLRPDLQAAAPTAAHETVLNRYHSCTRGGAWHTLPDDGTIHRTLTWHMEQAGWHEELRALLAEETDERHNAWHQVQERIGQVPAYRHDLYRAWARAGQEFAAGGPAAGLALAFQCRYTLVASSLHSLRREVPPALLCALVRDGLWTPAQGLATAAQVPDPALRAEALVGLAALPQMPASMTADLIDAALTIDDEEIRARALLAFAHDLPAEHVGRVLDGILHLECGGQRARALVELAPHLPPPAVERALAAALALEDSACRVEAVTGVLPVAAQAQVATHLPAELLSQALSAIIEIDDEPGRAAALARLLAPAAPSPPGNTCPEWQGPSGDGQRQPAPGLPETLCRQALACTWRMQDPAARSEAQAALAPHLSAYWREKALAAALDGLAQVHHARVTLLLASMAPHLPPSLQERAITLAEAQPDSHSRASALSALLPHLAPEYRGPAADLALRSTLLFRSEAARGEAIGRLAPHLPANLLEKALAITQSLADGPARAAAVVALAPFLDRRLAGTALGAAENIQDERSCAMSLAGLGPLLDAAQQRQALLRVRSLRDDKARAVALVGLAPVLAADLLPGALDEVRQIADERALAVTVAGIAPVFDEDGRAAILAIAARITDPAMRLDALLGVLPCLSSPQRSAGIEASRQAIQGLRHEETRIDALARLLGAVPAWCSARDGHAPPADCRPVSRGDVGDAAETLNDQILEEALTAVASCRDPERRCQVLLALAPHLPAALWAHTLAALPLDGQAPAAGLLALLPYLPGTLQARVADRCLTGARELPVPARGRVISGLVPYLDRRQLAAALRAMRQIGDFEEHVQALCALTPALEEVERREVLDDMSQVIERWKRSRRSATVTPQPLKVLPGGDLHAPPDGLAANGVACRPGFVPEMLPAGWREDLALSLRRATGDEECLAILRKASAAARAIDDSCLRALTLADLTALAAQTPLAPQLSLEAQQELAGQVLQAVRGCPTGPGACLLGQALAAIAPYLPAGQLAAALVEARRLLAVSPRPARGRNGLAALVRRLPEEVVRSELPAVGSIEDPVLRSSMLAALAMRLGELGNGQEALSATRPIEPLTCQVAALMDLAPYLSLPWLREALGMARELGRHGAPAAVCIVERLAELGEAEEAWGRAGEIPDHGRRAEALARLAPHLPDGRRAAAYACALQAALEARDGGERLWVLACLAPRLPHDLQVAALREALGAAVALKEAAAAGPRRAGQHRGATPLAALASPIASLAAATIDTDAGTLREIWLAGGQGERLLHLMGRQPRSTTLLELAILAPLLARLGGPPAVREILCAMQQVSRWWP